MQTTIFVCSGPQVVCEYQVSAETTPDPVSPSQRYVYGSYVDEVILKDGQFTDSTSGIVYYHRNQQYSIIALSNESGEVVERYAYTAYGETTIFDKDGEIVEIDQSAFANPYTYTARRADDEIGLLYFRARYYDPNTGEFISRDPLGFVDGMSQYRAYFVPGAVDPTGMVCQAPKGVCGPDLTTAFTSYLARSAPKLRRYHKWWRTQLTSKKLKDLHRFGNSIDFSTGRGAGIAVVYPGCGTGSCKGSIRLCGQCVGSNTANNILYGVVVRAIGLNRIWGKLGGHWNEFARNGQLEGAYQQSAYDAGHSIYLRLLGHPLRKHSKTAICSIIKEKLTVRPQFKNCGKCPLGVNGIKSLNMNLLTPPERTKPHGNSAVNLADQLPF